MWFLYAAGAAVFAAMTTILAKIGLKNVDSHLATAIRVIVVFAFAWLMVFIVGSAGEIRQVDGRTWVFLILSGLATGGSWLCFFRALQLGKVNQVVPIDKSSTIMTMILAFIFLRESLSALTVVGMVLMALGTWMMLELKKAKDMSCKDNEPGEKISRHGWLFFALLAAVFASLTAILGRVGIENIEANLGTAIRTMAVIPMSWLMVFITGGQKDIKKIDRSSWVFLLLSGVATGASWLLFYRALQLGNASHVVPIDKLSIVLTMGFAGLFLKERFSKRSLAGLVLLTTGTLLPILLA
ncbi:MAG: EamA family transporter [Oscillospiraceae bacterium]|nr:EamA family transporter [Oscillospiraceae bacterium]